MKVNCKINLKLKITGKREDGYHLLDMVMQEIDLYDELNIYKNNNQSNKKFFPPLKDNNIIIKTAKYLCEKYNLPFSDLQFDLVKKIPIAAGLGGGSADSANTIKQINDLFNLNLSYTDMINIAAKLGADVPFFIDGKIKHLTGIGEIIDDNIDIELPSNCYIIILTPNIYVPTKDIFSEYDELYTNNLLPKLNYKSKFYNDLSFVTIKKFPIIENFILKLNSLGAIDSQMSGSGPSIFAIFNSIKDAEYAKSQILKSDKKLIRYVGVHKPIL